MRSVLWAHLFFEQPLPTGVAEASAPSSSVPCPASLLPCSGRWSWPRSLSAATSVQPSSAALHPLCVCPLTPAGPRAHPVASDPWCCPPWGGVLSCSLNLPLLLALAPEVTVCSLPVCLCPVAPAAPASSPALPCQGVQEALGGGRGPPAPPRAWGAGQHISASHPTPTALGLLGQGNSSSSI